MKGRILAMTMFAASVASCQQLPPSSAASPQAGPARQATQAAADPAEFDRNLARVQDNVRQMDEQMARIRQTADPQERQRLLEEHWRTMQDSMAMMHGMWGPGMMGCCGQGPMMRGNMTSGGPAGPHMRGGPMMGGGMGWRNMQEYYSSLTPEQMKQRQYMTEQHMAMQQMMMNHMMQHQQWMARPPQR